MIPENKNTVIENTVIENTVYLTLIKHFKTSSKAKFTINVTQFLPF